MTLNDLIKIEDAAMEVWVVSPNLYFDVENQDFSEIVSVNLEQKTKYKYIVPATKDILKKLKLYQKKYNLTKKELKENFLLLPESDLNPFILETGIYNGSSEECTAFAAPSSVAGTEVITFSKKAAQEMAIHFINLWKKYKMTHP